MQKMIEGKGTANLIQTDFGSLIEQLLLCINRNYEECVKSVIRAEIDQFKKSLITSPKEEMEGFLTRSEAMKFLRLSAPSLSRYQKNGLLPYHKVGRKVYFKKTELVEATKIILKKKGAGS